MEPTVLDDEGIRIRLRQFDSGASFRSSDLALHVGLQDPSQMYRTKEVPIQVFPGSLGEFESNRSFLDSCTQIRIKQIRIIDVLTYKTCLNLESNPILSADNLFY